MDRRKDTVEAVLEQLIEHGQGEIAAVFTKAFELAMQIERLWRSLKSEDVYLPGYAGGRQTKPGIGHWIAFYNTGRPHQALGYSTPMTMWRDSIKCETGGTTVDMTLRLDKVCASSTSPQLQHHAA